MIKEVFLCNAFNLDTAANMLLLALSHGQYGRQSIELCTIALKSLQHYITENNEEFDLGKIVELVNLYFGNRRKTKRNDIIRFYRLLDEVIKFGYVRSSLFVGQRYYAFLSESNKQLINSYLESFYGCFKADTILQCKNCCSKLLIQIQLSSPGDDYSSVTLEQIQAFVEQTASGKKQERNAFQSKFMAYLHEQRGLSGCFQYWPHKINRPHFFFVENYFNDEQILHIEDLSSVDPEFTADVFHDLIPEFMQECINSKYEKSTLGARKEILKALYIFLDLNHLNYHFEIALQWADEFKGFSSIDRTVKRVLFQFDEFIQNGTFNPSHTYTYALTQMELLPPYYKNLIQEFLNFKKKEGWQPSTLAMCRSSAVRFCKYLVTYGNIPFNALTPELVMKFTVKDPHKTIQGRQAYLSRIRIFLNFLLDHEDIQDQSLLKAVRTISAPQVRVVQILDTEQIESVLNFCRTAQTPFELRDSAMLLNVIYLRGLTIERIIPGQKCYQEQVSFLAWFFCSCILHDL